MTSLTAVDVSKSYKGRKVVQEVSLDVGQGEVVGLLGPNGAGKTTTFYMIVGLTRPDSGSVLLGGHDITDLPMYLRAKNGIGYLPQEASVFRKLTVEANIMAILGLRALFFVLAGALDRFQYLKVGVAVILVFIGFKMALSGFVSVSTPVALGGIVVILAISVVASLLKTRSDAPGTG